MYFLSLFCHCVSLSVHLFIYIEEIKGNSILHGESPTRDNSQSIGRFFDVSSLVGNFLWGRDGLLIMLQFLAILQ